VIYGYIRVSTDRQTVENQRLEISTWSEKRGIKIDQWIEETISGTKSYKKGKFRSLILNTLKPGDSLIISEISRMSRNLLEIMEVLKYLMENDMAVKTVKEGYELGDNITSKVLAFAFGLSAEIERTLISERTKAGLRKRIEEGVILGRPPGGDGVKKLDGKQEDIRRYLDLGISMTKVSQIFKVHRETLRQFATAYDLYTPKTKSNLYYVTHKGLFDDYHEVIANHVAAGKSYTEISTQLVEEYGLPATNGNVRQYIARKGLYEQYCSIQLAKRLQANASVKKMSSPL
jgi:DNA invertase Pin-like site-specific DNA recombinase